MHSIMDVYVDDTALTLYVRKMGVHVIQLYAGNYEIR